MGEPESHKGEAEKHVTAVLMRVAHPCPRGNVKALASSRPLGCVTGWEAFYTGIGTAWRAAARASLERVRARAAPGGVAATEA